MSGMGLARIIGVGVICLIGIYGGMASGGGLFDVIAVFQIINTAILFVLMTFAYEFMQSRH